MALQKATKTSGAFLDLKELATDGPVLCVFRVREFLAPEESQSFKGVNVPVIADVLICSGPGTGEVHPGEKFIGAITNTLRGVAKPKDGPPLPPVNAVGAEIVARVEVINKGKGNAASVGNVPSDAEYAAVEKVYNDNGGEAVWSKTPANSSAQIPAQAGAGAGGGGRPW